MVMVLVMGNGQQQYHMCHCTGTVCCVLLNTTSLGCFGGLLWGAVLVNTTSMGCSDKYNLNGLFWGAVLGG